MHPVQVRKATGWLTPHLGPVPNLECCGQFFKRSRILNAAFQNRFGGFDSKLDFLGPLIQAP
jgi:hypothetical protein